MSTVTITTNEPINVRRLFVDRLETPLPFDMELFTNRCCLPIERKAVPGDLLSSVTDGRLLRELIAMREVSDFYIVLLHGIIKYKRDGRVDLEFRGQHPTKGWTKKGVRNLLRTLQFVEGAYIEWAHTDEELVEIVQELQEYFDENNHVSLRGRSKLYSGFPYKSRKARVINFYQGLPDCKYGRAKMLYETFPKPLQLYQASVEDINAIKGFGGVLSESIFNFLRTG